MDIEEYKEYENFKNRLLQRPITFLTEENLDKLEEHCRKAIRYERGIEHKVVLELLERYKEFLAEREEDKKRIEELEDENRVQRHQIMTVYDNGYVHKDKIKEDYIPKQKVKEKIEENNKLIEKCKDELEHYGEIYLYEHDNKILKELLEDK